MCAVQLDAVEARPLGALGGLDEAIQRDADVIQRHRFGAELFIRRRRLGIFDRAETAVVELRDSQRAMLADGAGETRQPRHVLLVMEAKLTGEAKAALLHRGGAGVDQAKAPGRAHGEPGELVLAQDAIGMRLQIGQRRQYETVLQYGARLQRQRSGKVCHASAASSAARTFAAS